MSLRRGKSLLGICFLSVLLGCAGVASRGTQALQQAASSPAYPLVNVPMDQYGGRLDIACGQSTGWFHAEKLNNRWWLCTPNGHGFFFQGVGAWTVPNLPKYSN